MSDIRAAILGAIFSLAAVASAQALNARTWVSGTGTDQASCGPIASPCRTLQYAHDQTTAGGEIDVKDSAGYGAVSVTKAINIVGEGSIAGVLAGSNANAITINAGSTDLIVLKSLTIEGAGVAANGIVFQSGGGLSVLNCTIQGFVGTSATAGNGILINYASGSPLFLLKDVTAINNGYAGLYASTHTAPGSLSIDHLTASGNRYGVQLVGGVPTLTSFAMTNSYFANNSVAGIRTFNFAGSYDSVTAVRNQVGIQIDESGSGGGSILFSRSVSTSNVGFDIAQTGADTLSFYKNNMFVQTNILHQSSLSPL